MDIKLILTDYESLPEYSGLNLVDVNQVNLFGDRPINIAATRGSSEELETLVAHGAPTINDAGGYGYTPFQCG
ncbi:MAG: ankyrin repeat domain-containing protein [Rhodocyclaceae bacterium]